MANQLTLIIPFLNEGQEIGNTLQSIRETAGNEVDILLINDASYDGFDYEPFAVKYNASYLCNEQRMGVAASRDIGVERITTPYFLLVDGHMRFYHNNWWKTIVSAIEQNHRALYCCRCITLDHRGEIVPNRHCFGAYIELFDTDSNSTLSAAWICHNRFPEQNKVPIPCVLGATYAASKSYWKYLKGLSGLLMYGSDEPYISLKVWLEGGQCILLKDIGVGHIFRNEFPYSIKHARVLFNKLLIAETLLPPEYRDNVYNILRKSSGIHLRDAMELLLERQEEIQALKKYYQSIFTQSFESFIELNAEAKANAMMPVAINQDKLAI